MAATGQSYARRQRAEAHARRRMQRSVPPGRDLILDPITVQRRTELAAELLSFYEFLTKLYLPTTCIKRPPKGGWPSITAERLAFLGKIDAVIDVLKHIPYISQDLAGKNDDRYQIFEDSLQRLCGIFFRTTGHQTPRRRGRRAIRLNFGRRLCEQASLGGKTRRHAAHRFVGSIEFQGWLLDLV